LKPSVLVVGEREMLTYTRGLLLGEFCRAATMNPAVTLEPLSARAYDLVIFCHTVSDAVATECIRLATAVNPNVKVLALSHGDTRALNSMEYIVAISQPARFRQCVVALLAPTDTLPS
jgi:hypothetical protein